ncbi:hypothetical protein BDW68DRAFT_178983 [Aspergillus falconensis]
MSTNQDPPSSSQGSDQPTIPTEVSTCPQHLRRHGPANKNATNFILAIFQNLIHIVKTRLVTKEFANPHSSLDLWSSRSMITVFADAQMPFDVYSDIHEAFLSLQDSLGGRDAKGATPELDENGEIHEGCIVIEWVERGIPLERFNDTPVSDTQWWDKVGLAMFPK